MKKLTIFSIDGTLLSVDTTAVMRRYLTDKGIVEYSHYEEREQQFRQQHIDGSLNMVEYAAFTLMPLMGMPLKEMEPLFYDCVQNYIIPLIYEEAKLNVEEALVDSDREHVIITSRNIIPMIDELARALNVKHSLATKVVVEDGIMLPQFDGAPCFQEGKLQRVKEWLSEHGREDYYDNITLYTGTINDSSLCEFVDTVRVVNPCEKLETIAKARSWDILEWGDALAVSDAPAKGINLQQLSAVDLRAEILPVSDASSQERKEKKALNKLIVFNVDSTLVSSDTPALLRQYFVDKGIVDSSVFEARESNFHEQFDDGNLNFNEYVAFTLSAVMDMPYRDLKPLLIDFSENYLIPLIHQEGRDLINEALTNNDGDDVIIISGNVRGVVEGLANALKIKHHIATKLLVESDTLLPLIDGAPCFQEGKVEHVKEWLSEYGREDYYDNIVLYTGTINDLPLCEFVDTVFIVNPIPNLETIAEARDWEILEWGDELTVSDASIKDIHLPPAVNLPVEKLIIFDLAATLVYGGTSVIWSEYLLEKGVVTDPQFVENDKAFQKQYADGTLNFEEYIRISLAPISHIPAKKLEEMLNDCVRSFILPNIFGEAKVLIQSLITTIGVENLLIISSTAGFIVEAVAKELGVHHAIGVDLVQKNGFFIPEIVGAPTFQAGKVARLKLWLVEHGRNDGYYKNIHYYTDSINDLPMCEFVDRTHVVNPCAQLRPIAETRDWEILEWSEQMTFSDVHMKNTNLEMISSVDLSSDNLTVFDLDETLVNGDTSVIWREYLLETGVITDPTFAERDKAFQKQYAEGTLNLEEYIRFSVEPITQISANNLEVMLSDCIHNRVLPHIFDEAKTLIKSLTERNGGENILIISATAEFIVKAVAKELGIHNAIGVDLAEKEGFYTPEIVGTPSFREGKVTRLKQWLAEHDRADNYYKQITFYTDSINDLPLCEFSDTVYTVNPCAQLRPIAQSSGWDIMNWG